MKPLDKTIFFVCSFFTGIIVSSFLKIELFWTWIIFLTAFMAVFILFVFQIKAKKIVFTLLFFLAFSLALFRFGLSEPGQTSIYFFDPESQREKIAFEGEIIQVKSKVRSQQLILDQIRIGDQKYRDKILVTTALYPEYQSGQHISLACDLQKPSRFDSFDYADYLANSRIYQVCYYPAIGQVIFPDEQNFFSKIRISFSKFQKQLKQKIDSNFAGHKAVLLKAMLLGDKDEFEKDLREQFARAGISHIVAISGMHITILSVIFFYFLIFLGVSRPKSFKYIFIFIIFYLALIGFRASAMRAGFLVLTVFYGLKIGRLGETKRTLLLAAFLLLLINPRFLIFDVGFQLSFLAVFGILFFYQQIKGFLDRFSRFSKINSLLAVTLSAQILTLPVVYFHFGIISLVSPLTNLLVVPLVPVILILGILFLLFSWLPFPWLLPIIFLLEFIFDYLLLVTRLATQIPFAFLQNIF